MSAASLILLILAIIVITGALTLIVRYLRMPNAWRDLARRHNSLSMAVRVVVADAERLGDLSLIDEANSLAAQARTLHTYVVSNIPRNATYRELREIDLDVRLGIIQHDLDNLRARLYPRLTQSSPVQ